ncbi:MAG: hypothetical protein HC844_11565 [Tabrizicola sp.]|nr:hypothetical protein [Tabrizicola sp.]
MPLPHFLGLIAVVIAAAGATVILLVWANAPLFAVSFAAVAASLIVTWNRIGR